MSRACRGNVRANVKLRKRLLSSMHSSHVVTVVSLFAATLSMISFVPQAWGIIRSRNTDGISLKMYVITVIGFLTWLLYGFLLMQWAIIVQNIICLVLSAFILTMKLLPQKKVEVVADALTPDFIAAPSSIAERSAGNEP